MAEKTDGAIIWRTIVTVVDVDTGEVRKRSEIGKYYYIIKKMSEQELKESTVQGTVTGSSEDAENKLHSSELKKTEGINGTPFVTVMYDGKFFVALGNYRISVYFDTKEEALDDAKRDDWDRRFQCMEIVFLTMPKNRKLENLKD